MPRTNAPATDGTKPARLLPQGAVPVRAGALLRTLAPHLVAGVLAFCLGLLSASTAQGSEIGEVQTVIYDAASRHGVDPNFMLRVAKCESGFRPSVVGPWGHVGVYQWDHRSFAEEAGWLGLVDISPWDVFWNVELAAVAIAEGRIWRWKACL